MASQGRWTQAVYAEARQSSRYWPSLNTVIDRQLLGEPIEVVDADQVNRIRIARLAGSPEKPTEHLGEAETCYLIHNCDEYKGAVWITDDHDAFDFGQQYGIVTWDTRHLFEMHIANAELTAQKAFELMQEMLALDRTLRRMPAHYRDLQ